MKIKRYRIYATVTGGKYLGTVEATSKEAACQAAWDLEEVYISLCHSCEGECEDATISEISAEREDD